MTRWGQVCPGELNHEREQSILVSRWYTTAQQEAWLGKGKEHSRVGYLETGEQDSAICDSKRGKGS